MVRLLRELDWAYLMQTGWERHTERFHSALAELFAEIRRGNGELLMDLLFENWESSVLDLPGDIREDEFGQVNMITVINAACVRAGMPVFAMECVVDEEDEIQGITRVDLQPHMGVSGFGLDDPPEAMVDKN